MKAVVLYDKADRSVEIRDVPVPTIGPEECLVVEDSRNGLLAAKGAGMKCIITQNAYTAGEDFREADLVLDCLGDPGGETARVLAAKVDIGAPEYLTLEHIKSMFP